MRKKIKLSNFEKEIDPVILKRGRNYWKSGLVSNIHWEDESIVASVRGTDLYRVEIMLDGSNLKDAYCNCPYDWGDYCKHIVAVLLGLKNEGLPASNKELLTEMLNSMSEDEMRTLLMEIMAKDPEWQNRFIARNSCKTEDVLNRYDTLLKEKIYSCSDEYGVLEYNRAYDVYILANEALSEAESLIRSMRYGPAFAVSKAVLLNMNAAIDDSDDSDGFIGGAVMNAIACINDIIAAPEVPRDVSDEIFAFFTDIDVIKQFEHFDWHYELIESIVEFADTKERKERLFDVAGALVDDSEISSGHSYASEWYLLLRLTYLEKFSSRKKMKQYIDDNLDVAPFRRLKLEKLYKSGKYDEVVQLAQEGVRKDVARAGLVHEWREWIVKGAEKSDNILIQREMLHQLFSDSFSIKHYRKLKSTYTVAEWGEKRAEILETVNGYWGCKAGLFIEEKMIDELWGLVSEHISLDALTEYDCHLLPKYKNEIRNQYLRFIPEFLDRTTGRKHYKSITRILSSRKKSLGADFCRELVNHLVEIYPSRRAMKEEFKSAGLL